MVHLDPEGSRGEHELAIEQYLLDLDPQLGAILAPYLRFARLDDLNDQERRRLRGEISIAVIKALDEEGKGE